MEPLISIIIPTYNRQEMIKNAIDSILKQDYKNYEIIVVDDCSKDNTNQVITSYKNSKIKYFRNKENSGAGITRKNGYLNSKGDYIIFMDDDDYYTDSCFFRKCVNTLQNNEEIVFVSGNSLIHYEDTDKFEFEQINLKGKVDGIEYLKGFQLKYKKANSTFTTMFKKNVFSEIQAMEILNDSSIYMSALLCGDAYILEDVVGVYRIHHSNITFNLKVDFLIDNLQEKKRIFDNLKEKIDSKEAKDWWNDQVKLTLEYFVNNTKTSKEDKEKLEKWCLENDYDINKIMK